MSREGKRVLDTLQAKLLLVTGKRISQRELLDDVVRLSAEREDELVSLRTGVKLPLPPEDVEKLFTSPTDWGVETKEDEVDMYLYGREGSKRA